MTNTWKRLYGPDKISLDQANAGDDATGDYGWSSLYGCGLARIEITHVLVVNDMNLEWGEDDNRAYVLEGTHLYTVLHLDDEDDYGEHDDEGPEDYEYETPGLHDYESDESERAHDALDEMASHDASWALCGPGEKAVEVTLRYPWLVSWESAMKFENSLDNNPATR